MKLTLNPDKTSMCGIGKLIFLTYENPGPIDLDPKTLNKQELIQLVYMIKTQKLTIDNLPELNAVLETYQKEQPKSQPSTIVVKETTIEEFKEQELSGLRKLITGSVA